MNFVVCLSNEPLSIHCNADMTDESNKVKSRKENLETKAISLYCSYYSTSEGTGIKTALFNTDFSLESKPSTLKFILGAGTDIFPWGWSSMDAQKVRLIYIVLTLRNAVITHLLFKTLRIKYYKDSLNFRRKRNYVFLVRRKHKLWQFCSWKRVIRVEVPGSNPSTCH